MQSDFFYLFFCWKKTTNLLLFKRHKFILFPTLLSACFGNLANKSILEQELGSDTLVAWLQEEAPSEKELKIPSRLSLCYRFPSSLKEEAVNFFSNSTINC